MTNWGLGHPEFSQDGGRTEFITYWRNVPNYSEIRLMEIRFGKKQAMSLPSAGAHRGHLVRLAVDDKHRVISLTGLFTNAHTREAFVNGKAFEVSAKTFPRSDECARG